MADEKNTEQNDTNQPKSMGAAAGAQAKESARQPDVNATRGGEQSDQISGETSKGAHNQEMKGRNPQGNKPDQNQSSRQQGNKF
jgi:hypothetical protein